MSKSYLGVQLTELPLPAESRRSSFPERYRRSRSTDRSARRRNDPRVAGGSGLARSERAVSDPSTHGLLGAGRSVEPAPTVPAHPNSYSPPGSILIPPRTMSLVGEPLPGGTSSIETYVDVWNAFGDREFAVDDLIEQSIDDEDRPVPARGELETRLDTLVAAGLLRWDGRDRYQVWCKPGESVTDWQAKLEPRTDVVHDLVREEMERRDLARTPEEVGVEHVEHDGERFTSVNVDADDPTLEEQLPVVVNVLDAARGGDHAGIVLRTAGDGAAQVQRLGDAFCDDEVMVDASCPYRFEKETSTVVGDDADALEYRLFLRTIERRDLT